VHQCAARGRRRSDYVFAVVVLEISTDGAIQRSVGRFGIQDIIADAAERLVSCARGSDVVARMAERRFGALLDDVGDAANAARAAERLLAALREGTTLSGTQVSIAASAGLAVSDGQTSLAGELVARAEAALESSKVAGVAGGTPAIYQRSSNPDDADRCA
jgi:GGDEF domain-containing protein